MRPRKRSRIAFAAWLGIVALAIQALIPALLAAEIDIADQEHGASVFTLCAFGHVHVATTHDEPGGTDTPQHDDELGAACPICIALIASPAFTAPAPVALPLPLAGAIASLAPIEGQEAPVRFATTAYRSRAPPIG
ncbi:MAG TPA: DUF2946 family protein [Stellaceae bacterium]|nr:DUF2946 family protein [Stellaceae bacterium]